MLQTLAIHGYRSVRDLVLPLGRLTVVTGANGVGKSNVYRALRLLASTAHGTLGRALADEGGLPSVLWAGPENPSRAMRRGEAPVQGTVRRQPTALRLGFCADDYGFAADVGLPAPGRSLFSLDPAFKREALWAGALYRPASALLERKRSLVQRRADDGQWQTVTNTLGSTDSLLTELADPLATPEVLLLRDRLRNWRFHDGFRTDAQAPARQSRQDTWSPVLAHDGGNLPAALQTILEIGDHDALAECIDDAFPGATVRIEATGGCFSLKLDQPGLLRSLNAAELSDGTLRYLLLVAALLSPRPPELIVLNEPETSLHPDLLPALARLIGRAAQLSQVLVVSHANRLVAGLAEMADTHMLALHKELGETRLALAADLPTPAWRWPAR